MDRTAAALVAFAAGPENVERRAAAMLMLAELQLDDARTVAVVADALGSDTVLQEYALRYVEKLRPAAVLPTLLPLLEASDPAARERARRVLVDFGAQAVAALARRGGDAGRTWLLGAVDVLATIASAPAIDALVTLVIRGDAEIARAAADTLHRRVREIDDRGRGVLLRHVLAAAERREVGASGAARLFLVRACAALTLPDARRWLLAEAMRTDLPHVRAEALAALAASIRREKLLAKEVTALIAILEDADSGHVVRQALEMLEGHRFGADAQPLLLRLSESPHVAVRSFALAKLGDTAAPGALKALLGSLEGSDAVRRSAAGSLRKIPEARQALMKRFATVTDASAAFTMAETLAGYGAAWRRPALEALWRRYVQAFATEDRIQGAFLHFLRGAAPEFLAESLRKESARLMKAGRARDAARLRQILRELPVATDEDAYQLALALVKLRRRGVDSPFRRPDPALDVLAALEERPFPTSTRLKRERTLEPEVLYAIGFALAESSGAGQRLGEELLEHVAKRQPRSRVGKSARNNLALSA